MAYSETLADRVRQVLGGRHGIGRRGIGRRGIDHKKMFGGVGFLLNGNMLVGVWKTSLIVRLGTEGYAQALEQPHVREFDITGRAMKGWVLVEADGIENDRQLADWIDRAVEFVAGLPAK